MKTLFTILIATLCTTFSFAQVETCDCKKDLDFLVKKMKKMPSYRKQIKKDKKELFENTYQALSEKMSTPLPIQQCYILLNQQMSLVNDVHARIDFNTKYFIEENSEDQSKISAFKKSDVFKSHPRFEGDLDSLKIGLSKKQENDFEGIYSYSDEQTIGVVKTTDKKYIGVVLSSENPLWEPGQIRFYAQQRNKIKYDVMSYALTTRSMQRVQSLSFENGRIWSYKKLGNTNNPELAIKENSDWEFKQLSDDVQYLYFGNFSSFSKKNMAYYKAFKDKVEGNLTANHIIVDLRSNAGGNSKLSDTFYKLLKKSGANIYILTNAFCGSNGEQFTLQLRTLDNAIHLGQTTRGIIAYGFNYGYNYETPSGKFTVKPTDMNFHKFIAYEGKGITPEIKLDFDKDWIEQTLELIAQESL